MADVASNKSYLDSKMDSIISTASNGSTGITIDSASYTSTSKIPSSEPLIEDTLLNSINILFQKIVKESQSIKAVGVDFQNMDNFLEGVSTNLGFEVMSKDEPIVDLIDYSDMNFEDLLNANIPSVPESYKNTGNSPLDKYYGNSGNSSSGSPSMSAPTTSANIPSQTSTTPSSTTGGDSSTSKIDYTLPTSDYSTKTKNIDVSKSDSSTKTTDYNPLSGFDISKKSDSTTKSSDISTSSTPKSNNSDDGLVRLSSINRGGGTSSRNPYVNTNPYSNTNGDDIIDVDNMEVLDDINPDDVIPEDYMESFVDNGNIPIIEDTGEVTVATSPKNENRTLRSLGIAAGVGLAAGTAALGAHSMMKSKEDYEDEDYGYESAGEF